MDHGSFDRIARLFGAAGTRRAALGALLGGGALGIAEAAAKENRRNRKSGRKGKGGVSAQAVCAPPSNGVNRNNCNYNDDDYSGQLIHSSSYKNTTWVDATLVGTDLHSSNFRGGSFRRADLTCAKLHSSTLTNVNFNGADLTLADLHSSACGGTSFNNDTIWCGTIDCNGNVRNDDCPLGTNACCADANCGEGGLCVDNECLAVCDEPFSGPECTCLGLQDGSGVACIQSDNTECPNACGPGGSCPSGSVCAISPCCANPTQGFCIQLCGDPADCVCAVAPTQCAGGLTACGTEVFPTARQRGTHARSGESPVP